MALVIKCPHCHAKLKAPDDALGKQGKCPECQGTVRVPSKLTPEA
jgi:hypothetical protein